MRIDTLCIDAGGVLVDPNWERVSAALRRHGIRADASRLADAEPHAKRALDVPACIRATDDRSRSWLFLDLVLEHAGVRVAPEIAARAWAEIADYHAHSNLWESVIPGVPEALARLRAMGLGLVVVSNANGKLRAKLDHLGIATAVDLVLDSYELGVEKPDPRIFAIALERMAAVAARTLHVGDLYEVDVLGARAAGIDAVLVDPAGLHADRDCPRVTSLADLADALAEGRV